jgi:protein involved in polysaccharide export with SLBB domain
VLQALALAGGPTEQAALGRIKIMRVVNGKQLDFRNVKLTQILQPGDTLIVPERVFGFFMAGDVNWPGTYSVAAASGGMTLLQALLADGPRATAGPDVIIRRNNSAPATTAIDGTAIGPDVESITYNRADLEAGRIPEPLLMPGDTVYVPKRLSTFSVNGDVARPGMFSVTSDEIMLLHALTMAGLNATAGFEIQVRRHNSLGASGAIDANNAGVEIEVFTFNRADVESGRIDDPKLQNGDSIYVPKAKTLLVEGDVRTPGIVTLRPGMTVYDAITAAGGLTSQAAMNRTVLRRTDSKTGKTEAIKVTEKTLVQADDVIFVPKRYF